MPLLRTTLQCNDGLIRLKGSTGCLNKLDFWRVYVNKKNVERPDSYYFLNDFSGDLSQQRQCRYRASARS